VKAKKEQLLRITMTRKMLAGLSVISLAILVGLSPWLLGRTAAAQGSAPGVVVPKFQVDPTWPRLPNNWVLGEISSVAVDRRDHVWILNRPRSVTKGQEDKAAPAVLEFDPAGNFVQAFGGPSDTYEWPDNEHGIFVDYKDKVWIGGNNPAPASGSVSQRSDDMLLKFTNKGKFVMQIGRRDQSGGNKDTMNLKRPADVFVYPKTNEAFVADGYGNRRLIVIDADTGAFKRMWGAFGNTPLDPPPPAPRPAPPAGGATATPTATAPDREGPGPQQFGIVHGVKVSNDGLVYVADRGNSRIQVFTLAGKYITQGFINRNEGGALTAAGLAFSPDPQQQFIYVADQSNSHIHVVLRKTLEVLYTIGRRGSNPGDFQGLHHIAADSKGNVYTAEAQVGKRAQKFVFTGMSAAATR
jgi:DNA-binding beta-propeller fold protein YncE